MQRANIVDRVELVLGIGSNGSECGDREERLHLVLGVVVFKFDDS